MCERSSYKSHTLSEFIDLSASDKFTGGGFKVNLNDMGWFNGGGG